MSCKIMPPTEENLRAACHLLQSGELLGLPTETVYGLAANARDERAVAKIYEAKGRPSFNPLIIHIRDAVQAAEYTVWHPLAQRLAEAFWPGPLTLVLKRRPESPLSLLAMAGLDSVAVRAPAHPVAREVLRQSGLPLAAPSANRSGRISPTRAHHVAEELEGRLEMVLDGGACTVGIESTIVDVQNPETPLILRPGSITPAMLEAVIGQPLELSGKKASAITAPGQMESHYAPHLPVRLQVTHPLPDEILLAFGSPPADRHPAAMLQLSETGDLLEAAANLFHHLRAADRPGYRGIAVMPIPEEGLGIAINDRLRRAAAPRP